MLSPRCTKIALKRAASDAITRSQPSARLSPAPAATPFTLAMVGLPMSRSAAALRPTPRMCSSRPPVPRGMSCATRSAPAQKPLPAPVITSTRSSRLLATSSNTSRSPPHIAPVIELSLSGRFSVSVTTPSRRSTRRSSGIGRYRSGVGLNPFRSQAKRGTDVVIVAVALVVVAALVLWAVFG